jgi:hypothetical protein
MMHFLIIQACLLFYIDPAILTRLSRSIQYRHSSKFISVMVGALHICASRVAAHFVALAVILKTVWSFWKTAEDSDSREVAALTDLRSLLQQAHMSVRRSNQVKEGSRW